MKNFKTVQAQTFELQSITCNKCGTTTELAAHPSKAAVQENLHHTFNVHFGYGSDFDEEKWQFELCENCLVEFVQTFVVKPTVSNY